MLMKVQTLLEPIERLRCVIPNELSATLERLLGTVTPPPDQPACASAVLTLAECFSLHSKTTVLSH